MRRARVLLAVLVLVMCLGGQAFAIERVAAKFGYLEIRSAYAMPLGTYGGLPGFDFVFDDDGTFDFDADRVYDDGFALGLTYGQLLGPNWRASLGFDYARNKVKNPILQQSGIYEYRISFSDDQTYQQYDLTFRGALAPWSLVQSTWTPFVGIGAAVGLGSLSTPGYSSEYEFYTALSLDLGLDVKLWTAPDDRSFVVLSSLNSWNFLATGERISHLQIGGGLRYFFKP